MSRWLPCIAILLTILLSACNNGTPTPPTSAPSPTPDVRLENVRTEREPYTTNSVPLENCNGTSEVTQTISRTETVTVETEYGGSAELSAGIKSILDAKLGAQFNVTNGQVREFKQEFKLSADASKKVAYEIRWYATYQTGEAVLAGLNLRVPFRMRTGLDGELGSGAPLTCPTPGGATAVPASNTPPPSATPRPTNTPAPSATDTPAPSATPAPTQTPRPTDTPTAPTTTPPPTPTALTTATLRLFRDSDTLTLYVATGLVNLSGLQFRVVGRPDISLQSRFDALQLANGLAQAGDCYVLRRAGSSSPLAGNCARPDRVYRADLALSDVFWYDTVTNQPGAVAILQDGNPLTVCSPTAPDCEVQYPVTASAPAVPTRPLPTATNIPPTPTSVPPSVTPAPTYTATPTVGAAQQGYLCPATVKDTGGGSATVLNIIRSAPIYASSPVASVRNGQPVIVVRKELEGSRTVWYFIRDAQGKDIGYIYEDNLTLSAACPS
jgi:hypothetical protein